MEIQGVRIQTDGEEVGEGVDANGSCASWRRRKVIPD
jgi:hypothetical protein